MVLIAIFVVLEGRKADPLLPLGLFRSRQFSAANLVTFTVYAALAGALFLLPVQLQLVAGFSPVAGRHRHAADHRGDAAAVRPDGPAVGADRTAHPDDRRADRRRARRWSG